MKTKYYFSNRELLITAVLSGLGGIMSTYIGYLGNLLNRVLGVPFGAGQFVAGLHVFWIILVAGIIKKPGSAAMTGLLKGLVEFLTGSTHGIVIVLISFGQGILVDLVILILKRHTLTTYIIAGAIAAISNVVLFQLIYFSGVPLSYLLFISGLAAISGVLFAGCFGQGVLDIVNTMQPGKSAGEKTKKSAAKIKWQFILTSLFIFILSGGALYYYTAIYQFPGNDEVQLEVLGEVENELQLNLSQLEDKQKTITAELKGQVTNVPEKDYTGVPLQYILEIAEPKAGASQLIAIAADGYEVSFPLQDVLEDEKMLVIEEEESLRLVAGNYEGGYWVRELIRLVIK